jgi:hypothetical protein
VNNGSGVPALSVGNTGCAVLNGSGVPALSVGNTGCAVLNESGVPAESVGKPGCAVLNESGVPAESVGKPGCAVFKLKKTKKLKQDDFEHRRVLERDAQTPLVLDGTCDTHDSMSRGKNTESNARSHDENSASAINENSESASLND